MNTPQSMSLVSSISIAGYGHGRGSLTGGYGLSVSVADVASRLEMGGAEWTDKDKGEDEHRRPGAGMR